MVPPSSLSPFWFIHKRSSLSPRQSLKVKVLVAVIKVIFCCDNKKKEKERKTQQVAAAKVCRHLLSYSITTRKFPMMIAIITV